MLTPKDLKDKRVLIVDDDDDFREAMALSFDRLGCEVMTASNGREAFDLTQRQPVDVVVSDIRMPNGDGVELMERLKANSATAPVLLLITGYAEVTVEEVLNKGAEALINKPFKPLTLQEAIARLLTPPEQRWEQHSDRVEVDLKIQLKVEGIEKAIEEIGRAHV